MICTRNRAEQLKPCLEYVARLEASCPWELIVVDNGSTDATREILASFAASAAFPVTVLFEPKPGLGRARNTGWRAAKGEIIAFTDDDCYLAHDYIDRVRDIFDDQQIGFGGGRVELFDPTDAPLTIRTEVEPELLPPRSFVDPGWILGANMMIRRDLLDAIGGFDPDLGAGTPLCCEDIDMQARASAAGGAGLYAPMAVVAHHHGRKPGTGSAGALNRAYSIGIGGYVAKHALAPQTRSIYARMWLRRWYWWFRQALCGGNGLTIIGWEAKGAARYLALRLRRAARSPLNARLPSDDQRSEKAS